MLRPFSPFHLVQSMRWHRPRLRPPASVNLIQTIPHRYGQGCFHGASQWCLVDNWDYRDRRAHYKDTNVTRPKNKGAAGLCQELGNMLFSLCFYLYICFFPRSYRQAGLLCAPTLKYLGSSQIHSLGRSHSLTSRLLAEKIQLAWLSE